MSLLLGRSRIQYGSGIDSRERDPQVFGQYIADVGGHREDLLPPLVRGVGRAHEIIRQQAEEVVSQRWGNQNQNIVLLG